jgi:phospholipid/cholesterol/gamma-HCH transport system substrate-binding protein
MPSARRVRFAEFRVAATAVAALAILLVLCYLLTGGGTLLTPKVTVYLYIPDATGLRVRSSVRVEGIEVGKVSRVELNEARTGVDPNRVIRLHLAIEEDHLASIPADSTAQLTPETLIGDKFVDIDSGVSPTHLVAGGEIAYKPEANLMKSLDLRQFLEQLRQFDANLREIEEGRNDLGRFILGEDEYNEALRLAVRIQGAVEGAAKTTAQIGAVVYSDQLYRDVATRLSEVDQTIQRFQSATLLRDDAQFRQVRDSIAGIRESIAGLRQGSLIQSDDLYNTANQAVSSLVRQVDEFNAGPWFGSTLTYDNLNGMAREIGDTIKEFREDPKKFLWLKVF